MKLSKIPRAAWLVIAFVVVFALGLLNEARAAEPRHDIVIGLGYGVINADGAITQRLGYMYDRRWYARAERFGGPRYDDDPTWVYSLGRRVSWRRERAVAPFMEFGVAKYEEPLTREDGYAPVTAEWTYTLGVGVSLWGIIDAGLAHNSTAGRSSNNDGIDRVYLSFTFEL